MIVQMLATSARVAAPFYILFAGQQVNLDGAMLGLLTLAFLGADTISNLVWGYLGDRSGYRLVLLFTILLWIASTALLMTVPTLGPGVDDGKVAEQVEISVKYAGYLDRQREEIERQQRHENTPIPDGFDYAVVRGLSAEVLQKLERVRPQTVGQAQRIPGMTPAAVSLLLVHLERSRRSKVA